MTYVRLPKRSPRARGALFSGLLVMLYLVGCGPDPAQPTGTPNPGPGVSNLDGPVLTLLLTGQAMSTLKPCGCSETQLGGMSRRQAVLDTVSPERRLVIDTGGLLAADSEQDRIKLEVFFQALTILNYDLVHLDADDYRIAQERGLLGTRPFEWITSASAPVPKSFPSRWSRTIDIDGHRIHVVVVASSVASATPQALAQAFGLDVDGPQLRVLITPDALPIEPDILAQWSCVDLVIGPAVANEPEVHRRADRGPWVISVGRLGEYFARLRVRWGPANQPNFRLDAIPIDNTLPEDPLLAELYENYKLRLKDERLIDGVPQLPLPGNVGYVGSNTCNSCHEYEHERWSSKNHARAYRTLVEINQHYDPECIACHVVGFGYTTGYRNETSPPDLRDVGCEVCHGPGSAHVASRLAGGPYVSPGQPRRRCADCHTPDHSLGYAGHEEEYFRKIVHWREQGGS